MAGDEPPPRVTVVADEAALAIRSADIVCEAIAAVPWATLVLPTGRTPLGLYAELVRRVRGGRLNLGSTRILALDEYAGLPPADARLLGDWLDRALVAPAGLPRNLHVRFRSDAGGEEAECTRLEGEAETQGVDLLVLGLGPNGHLGFNEPGSAFDSRTRVAELSETSLASNAAYWDDGAAVPRRGYTLGLGVLARARRTLLMVSGGGKAAILERLLHGPVGPDNPSTILRTMPKVEIVADRAAAGRLRDGAPGR